MTVRPIDVNPLVGLEFSVICLLDGRATLAISLCPRKSALDELAPALSLHDNRMTAR